MSKEIQLTRGMVTIVDDEDYEWLSQWKWQAVKSRSLWYACRQDRTNGQIRHVRMHRVLINAPDGVLVDHINRNPLDNRKENLRLSTHRENQHNSTQYELQLAGKKRARLTASSCLRHDAWTVTVTISRIPDKTTARRVSDEAAMLIRQIIER